MIEITKDVYIAVYLEARRKYLLPKEGFPGSEIVLDGFTCGYRFEYEGEIYYGVDLNAKEDIPKDPLYRKDFVNTCIFYKIPI